MKTCIKCDERKPLGCFYRRKGANGHDSLCRRCRIADSRRRSIANPEAARERGRRHTRKKHGWTDDLVQQRLREQEWMCAICFIPFDGDNFHADHDHLTNEPRGLLCAQCNHGLGRFRENTDTLKQAVLYLQAHNAEYAALVNAELALRHPTTPKEGTP